MPPIWSWGLVDGECPMGYLVFAAAGLQEDTPAPNPSLAT